MDSSSEWTDDIVYLDESGDVIFSRKGIRSVNPGLNDHVMVGSMKKPFSNASVVAKMVEIVKRWKWGPEMESQLDKLHFVSNMSHVKQALSEIGEIYVSMGLFGWAKRQSWYSPKDEIYVLLFDQLNQNGDETHTYASKFFYQNMRKTRASDATVVYQNMEQR